MSRDEGAVRRLRRSARQQRPPAPCSAMELPQAEPPRCLQASLAGVTVGVSWMHQPPDRELLHRQHRYRQATHEYRILLAFPMLHVSEHSWISPAIHHESVLYSMS